MSLQASSPASQVMVTFHTMSVDTESSPTLRSARARCMMKKFIRDLRVLGESCVMSTSELPDTITVSSRQMNTSCSVCKTRRNKYPGRDNNTNTTL